MGSRHLSLRISEIDYQKLQVLAKSENETVSETVRRLIEEGRRMAEHPGISFRDGYRERVAAVSHGPPVWKIIDVFPQWDSNWDIRSPETLGATSVNAWQVMVAQRYYRSYAEEIDELIRSNRATAAEAYTEWLETQRTPIR
ncbi:MAG TPA: hypothetical protein VFY10_13400 [Dehalococcoidia bacterium]|nr:hypothetical protein [Dehalococcoidia bacterium]